MKKIIVILAVLLTFLFPSCAYADENPSTEEILSPLSEADTSDIKGSLDGLGIDSSDPESVRDLSPNKLLSFVASVFSEALKTPLKIVLTVSVFAAFCSVTQTLSFKTGLYGELFVLICFIALSPTMVEAFSNAVVAIKGASRFMLAYIPVFASLAAASGNLSAAVSYNAVLMYFCEGAAIIASSVLKPILCCMLALTASQALDPNLGNITAALKNIVTTVLGFVMTLFLGIIGLQTIVGRTAEGLAVKAGKYAVSSFVPIIGYSLSESYKAVSLSLSAIRTTVGALGVIILFLFALTPIVTALVYKSSLVFCGWICRLMGADRLSGLMYGLGDVFSFLSTVLIFFMLMLTVATGMLILLGGTVTA